MTSLIRFRFPNFRRLKSLAKADVAAKCLPRLIFQGPMKSIACLGVFFLSLVIWADNQPATAPAQAAAAPPLPIPPVPQVQSPPLARAPARAPVARVLPQPFPRTNSAVIAGPEIFAWDAKEKTIDV